MKADEFLQALNQCAENKKCEGCPLASNPHCRQELMVFAHGTINRLYHNIQLTAKEQYTNGRNDGIREFAEKLKAKSDYTYIAKIDCLAYRILDRDLESLVKEMTEDGNGGNNR